MVLIASCSESNAHSTYSKMLIGAEASRPVLIDQETGYFIKIVGKIDHVKVRVEKINKSKSPGKDTAHTAFRYFILFAKCSLSGDKQNDTVS